MMTALVYTIVMSTEFLALTFLIVVSGRACLERLEVVTWVTSVFS